MLISWVDIYVYLTGLWHLEGNEPHDYAYVFGAFHSYDISLYFIVVPLLYDLVAMLFWSLYFIFMPLLYDIGVIPLLYDFVSMSSPCSMILLLCYALALWFCCHALALQFSSRVCRCWFLLLLNMYLFISPFEHVCLEIFFKVLITY